MIELSIFVAAMMIVFAIYIQLANIMPFANFMTQAKIMSIMGGAIIVLASAIYFGFAYFGVI